MERKKNLEKISLFSISIFVCLVHAIEYICLYMSIDIIFKFSTMNFPEVTFEISRKKFCVPAAQDGSDLLSWNGPLFYNILDRTSNGRSEKPCQILRLFAMILDSNLGT